MKNSKATAGRRHAERGIKSTAELHAFTTFPAVLAYLVQVHHEWYLKV